MFGFEKEEKLESDGRQYVSHMYLKCGRSRVMYKDENRTWLSGELAVESKILGPGCYCQSTAAENIMKLLSGKELIVRATEKPRDTPYGFTRVRTERHILLPEFGSVEELRLRLEAMG